jgi:hypothetical protein
MFFFHLLSGDGLHLAFFITCIRPFWDHFQVLISPSSPKASSEPSPQDSWASFPSPFWPFFTLHELLVHATSGVINSSGAR